MARRLSLTIVWLIAITQLAAQNYNIIPAKEEYDKYFENRMLYEGDAFNPCYANPGNDSREFGDDLSKMLEGLLTMYETTGDKGYLYRFMHLSLCMVENRHDYQPEQDINQPRWAYEPDMYQDGYIIGAFARFTHLVMVRQPSLVQTPVFPFDEFNPGMYEPNTCNCNKFDATFSTFGLYALWLQTQAMQTLEWYLNNGYWDNHWGMQQFSSTHTTGATINFQIGFGRALMFLGMTMNYSPYLDKARKIADLFKSKVKFTDVCLSPNEHYDDNVLLYDNGTNSYSWLHAGWAVSKHDCFASLWLPVGNYYSFTEYKEDISHGGVVSYLPIDFYKYLNPNPVFTIGDMVRFRNMFTKKIYLANNTFANAVDGADNPIYSTNTNCNPLCPPNLHHTKAISFMPYHLYDGADASASVPNVYDILMEYYTTMFQGANTIPSGYVPQSNKGHAELVEAQWLRECPDLKLFNRQVVYDQDFFAKGQLDVAPLEATTYAFAQPQVYDQEFVIKSGVKSELFARNGVTLYGGFTAEAGSELIVYTIERECAGNWVIEAPENKPQQENSDRMVAEQMRLSETEKATTGVSEAPKVEIFEPIIFPNPAKDRIQIMHQTSNVSMRILSLDGIMINHFQDINSYFSLDITNLKNGLYVLELTNGEIVVRKQLVVAK